MNSDFIIYANDKKSKFLMLTKNDYMWCNCIIISLPNFVEFEDFNTKVHSYMYMYTRVVKNMHGMGVQCTCSKYRNQQIKGISINIMLYQQLS